MGVLWAAVRQGSKGLGRSPGFVVLVTLSLGLAVGVDALVLTWLEGLVLRPFPAIREAERLVAPSPTAADGSVALVTMLVCGGVPAWRLARTDPAKTLGSGRAPAALGASRRDLVRDVFGRGLGWTLSSLAGGGTVAFGLARILRAE